MEKESTYYATIRPLPIKPLDLIIHESCISCVNIFATQCIVKSHGLYQDTLMTLAPLVMLSCLCDSECIQ